MTATVTITGGLTRDPELRFTQAGKAVATLGVAVSRRYQVNNEWQEETSFFNVVAWGQLGENVASSLGKGDQIVVTGRLQQRSWDKDGEKKYITEIVVRPFTGSVQAQSKDKREPGQDRDEDRGSDFGRSSGGSGRSQSRDLDDDIPF